MTARELWFVLGRLTDDVLDRPVRLGGDYVCNAVNVRPDVDGRDGVQLGEYPDHEHCVFYKEDDA